jgi:hypothetical protein
MWYDLAMPVKKGKERQKPHVYDPEVLYPYFKEAGSNISEAMRLAEAAGDNRVPSKHTTWGDYVVEFAFTERLRKEEKAKWAAFHAEREEKQQQVLDKVAHTFEVVFDFFAQSAVSHIDNLQSPDEEKQQASREALLKMFGSMEAVDKFYRMYLRSRGQPEKITKMEHDGHIATTYFDLEDMPKAKSPEEAKQIAEGKQAA